MAESSDPEASPGIETVLAHLRERRAGAALALLLAEWRRVRAAPIADLLDLVTKQVSRSLPALEGTRDELQTRWLDLAAQRRAVDVGRLLDALPEGSMGGLRKRYGLLGSLAPDPRLVATALTIPTRYHSYEAGPLLTIA